jgi:hypothetical protein
MFIYICFNSDSFLTSEKTAKLQHQQQTSFTMSARRQWGVKMGGMDKAILVTGRKNPTRLRDV